MKNLILIFCFISISSCGIITDTEEDEYLYTYILTNETGVPIEITGGFERETNIIANSGFFKCSFLASFSYAGGLCSGFVEIRIPNTNTGYRCYGLIDQVEGLCFVEDGRLFTRLEGTILTEISPRTYEYVLTPDLLENAYELPD